MARRRPTPKDVPDAVRDAVDRTVQATIGSAQLTRGRAQEAVDELVRTAESRAGAVGKAVRGAIDERRPATGDDMTEIRRELRSISRRLAAIERRLPAEAPATGGRSATTAGGTARTGGSTVKTGGGPAKRPGGGRGSAARGGKSSR